MLCGCGHDDAHYAEGFICGRADDCAVIGDALVTVQRGSIKCFGLDGSLRGEYSTEPDEPLLAKSEHRVAVYSADGRTAAFADGAVIKTHADIISVRLSDSGHAAVCTEESGYKGLVSVYDGTGSLVYRWYSADSAVISASVSPEGERLAILTEAGVRLFSLDSEDERGSFECSDMHSVFWLGDNVCVLGSGSAAVCTDEGAARGELEFDGAVGAWCANADALAVEADGQVLILSERLRVRERINPDSAVLCLDFRGDDILILTQKTISKYNGDKLVLSEDASGAGAALLLPDGTVLAVGGGSAWTVKDG